MTDRELLEAAARAAGMSHPDGWDWLKNPLGDKWNPLTDDGDALRLLLKLQLRLDYVGDQPCVSGVLQSGMTIEASFRRAVVRAAAAVAGQG